MARYDAVFVGSGVNALVGAALLAREGWSVAVLERSDRLGGAIYTVPDYTRPGVHPRALQRLAPALRRLARVCRARRRAHPARASST